MDYTLEKKVWTDQDFEQMGWHDCNIYKIRLTEDLELDIDYILQWNKPDLEGLPFTFWATLAQVFRRRRVTCDNQFRRTVSGSTTPAPCILIAASLAFCSNTRKP
jgi:hypothetical protein